MLRKSRVPKPLESEIQKTAMAILKQRGILHFRSNAGVGWRENKDGTKRPVRAAPKDFPDLIGVAPRSWGRNAGAFIGAEAKREGEHPREGQLAILRQINESGGLGFWFDSVADFEHALDRFSQGWSVTIDASGECVLVPPQPPSVPSNTASTSSAETPSG